MVSRKEQSLNLFHALGKIFYNKRKLLPFCVSLPLRTIEGSMISMSKRTMRSCMLLYALCQSKTSSRRTWSSSSEANQWFRWRSARPSPTLPELTEIT